MSRRRASRSRHGQRGLAMVELAIVLPIIVILTLAVTEIGRALMHYNALTKGLQDGARHAAAYGLLGTTGSVMIDSALATEIRNLVVYGDAQGAGEPLIEGLSTAQISITVPAPGLIEVAADYAYVPVMGSAIPLFGYGSGASLGIDLSASVRMRAL